MRAVNTVNVPLVQVSDVNDVSSIEVAIAGQPLYLIDNVNWPEEFPSKPKVEFKMAHNGSYLFLQFFVEENEILAKVEEDNGEVWTDSCVEFFFAPKEGGEYYNAEFTCIGKALLGHRVSRDSAEHANSEIMKNIKRYPSLGTKTFDKTSGDNKWNMILAIPAATFWKDDIKSFSGLRARGNVYKCGDNLTTPHFLSWNSIKTEKPNFHVPAFFGEFIFE